MIEPSHYLKEIAARRFGPDHEQKCLRSTVTACAVWDCQLANCCQDDPQWASKRDAASLDFRGNLLASLTRYEWLEPTPK